MRAHLQASGYQASPFVRPDRLPAIPGAEVPDEAVGVQDVPLVGDPEAKELPVKGVEGDVEVVCGEDGDAEALGVTALESFFGARGRSGNSHAQPIEPSGSIILGRRRIWFRSLGRMNPL